MPTSVANMAALASRSLSVVANDEVLEGVLAKLDKDGIPRGHVVLRFTATQPVTMIL